MQELAERVQAAVLGHEWVRYLLSHEWLLYAVSHVWVLCLVAGVVGVAVLRLMGGRRAGASATTRKTSQADPGRDPNSRAPSTPPPGSGNCEWHLIEERGRNSLRKFMCWQCGAEAYSLTTKPPADCKRDATPKPL